MPTKHNNKLNTSVSTKYDVVVIGAGLGGLTAAALLSKAGMDVCVVEMASRPGGCLAGFDRKGFHFETAIHWLNQCGPNGFVRRVFDFIAPGSPRTVENKRIRRHLSDSYNYLLTSNPDDMQDELISHCPDEKRSIQKFFRASKGTAKAFSRLSDFCRSPETMSIKEKLKLLITVNKAALPLIRYSPFSAERGLNTFFRSSCLKRIFSTEERLLSCLVPIGWAYDNDYQLPPQGGSRAFAQWLCDILKNWKAPVLYNNRVTEIFLENGRASGVKCIHNGEENSIRSTYVIAACDVETLYSKMLPEGVVNKKIISKQHNAELYNSCVTISLGLDCPASDLELNEEQVLLKRDDISRKEQMSEAPDKTEISIIASSFRDPSLAPEGKGSISLYAPSSLSYGNYWQAERDSIGNLLRGKAYTSFKQKYSDTIIKRVEEKYIPGLRDHIEVLDIATPLTYMRYTDNRNGAIMGFRPSFRNIRNRIAHYTTPVKNLFIGSQWAELGGGIPNAVKTGMNSALLIIKHEAPEVFKIISDVIDGRVSPKEVFSPNLRTSAERIQD